MKRLALAAVTLLGACDNTYVTRPAPIEDPCLYHTYHDPMCDSGFSWSPGYYNSTHAWVTPRYVRRTVTVPHAFPPPPVVVNRSVVTSRPTYRSPYRSPVTTTTRRYH